ncbi:class I SAM-dependent methyltransferase [Emcibacter sp. SYSU 3D8]|uniref:class I SAM-dependent methyltransferase n=1 Tax=Emcibacter sp. SYSU 3D8 TaxID=3133969 RepID=UPI0031FF1FA2
MSQRKLHPRLWQPTYMLNRALSRTISGWAEQYFAPTEHHRLLDIGCGSMPYRVLFQDRVSEYVGCDQYPRNATVVGCPADDLSFPDESFDSVVCFQVLEHVPEPWRVLDEASRVLKARGLAIVTVPFLFPYHSSPGDYYRYTHEGIQAMSARSGFDIVEVDPQCATLPTLLMIVNIKASEQLRRFNRFALLRPLAGAIEGLFVASVNVLALLFDALDRKRNLRGFRGYANYSFVLRKRALVVGGPQP